MQEAVSWKGTPFVHQGRAKGIGGDCIACVIGPAKKYGYAEKVGFKDIINYKRMPDANMMQKALLKYLDKVSILKDALPADILHFYFYGKPQHVAILLEDHYIVHADETVKKNYETGEVVVHRMEDWWWSRVVGVYRFRGIDNG